MNSYSSLDLVGYEPFIELIEKEELYKLEGDMLEIGSFLGGGTAKLAEIGEKYNKNVYTADIFSPEFDTTKNLQGISMAEIYSMILQGKKQIDIFNKVTENFDNIKVIMGDSKELKFPEDQKFFFSFIDGNHSPEYVVNDFKIAWKYTVSGGAVGFHDYEGDLPPTTEAINKIMKEYEKEIMKIERFPERWSVFLFKK